MKIIELIQIYGDEIPANAGCVIRYFPKKGLEYVYSELSKTEKKMLKNKENAYIIENDGFVVTTGYLYKRIVRH